jgi:type VI secretion system protein ImpM
VEAALAASRQALGDGWLGAWMEAPIWRFALPNGACGPDAVLGSTMPSVDRVGRHYPLTVAAVFGGVDGAPGCVGWLEAAEQAALDALALDRAPDALGAALDSIAEPAWEAGAAGWWTAGSPRVPACRLTIAGLPAAADFAAMIDAGGAA